MPVKQPRPTPAELEILQVLWAAGPAPVRQIQQVLNGGRPTGYTTVLKLLQIMLEKGLVQRDESQRPQVYRARYRREQTQKRLLTEFVDRAFGGSVKALVLQALSGRVSTRKNSPRSRRFSIGWKGETNDRPCSCH